MEVLRNDSIYNPHLQDIYKWCSSQWVQWNCHNRIRQGTQYRKTVWSGPGKCRMDRWYKLVSLPHSNDPQDRDMHWGQQLSGRLDSSSLKKLIKWNLNVLYNSSL